MLQRLNHMAVEGKQQPWLWKSEQVRQQWSRSRGRKSFPSALIHRAHTFTATTFNLTTGEHYELSETSQKLLTSGMNREYKINFLDTTMTLFSLILLLLVTCGLPLLLKRRQTLSHVSQIIADYSKLSRPSSDEKLLYPGLLAGRSGVCVIANTSYCTWINDIFNWVDYG